MLDFLFFLISSYLDAVHHGPAVQTAGPPGLSCGSTGGRAGAPLRPLNLGLRLAGDAGPLQPLLLPPLVVPQYQLLPSASISTS